MNASVRSRLVATVLGLLACAPFARAESIATARAALAAGDFSAMRTAIDAVLAAEPTSGNALVLRSIARLGQATETDLPAFLRARLGATVAAVDINTGDLALRFTRQPAYFSAPTFTVAGPAYFGYEPFLDLYTNFGPQPSLSFENRGTTAHTFTLVVSQPGQEALDFDSTLYLDGIALGYVNALNRFPFGVFIPPTFEIGGNIPQPFDLQFTTPDFYLSEGPVPNSFTVYLPPKSSFSIGLQTSAGNLRFTPTEPLPSTIAVINGRVGGIRLPSLPAKANLSDFVRFAADLDAAVLAPAIADLERVPSNLNLVLTPSETGHATDLVIGYPDVQIILAELKFAQAVRRLSTSYRFSQAITPGLFDADLLDTLKRNPAFLTPEPASSARTADRVLARSLILAATDHYAAAAEAGLWTRPAPTSGAYLFNAPIEQEVVVGDDTTPQEENLDVTTEDTVNAFFAGLREVVESSTFLPIGGAESSAVSLVPLFGNPAVNIRKLLPVTTSEGIVRGTSTELLTRGFILDAGTANWEAFLAESELLDLTTPALQTAPKIQRQPAALTSVEEGEPATLSVLAECYPAPAYQWYRGTGSSAVPIAGATGPSLVFESVSREDAGVYTVRVTNTRQLSRPVTTTVASINARLYVTYAPEIVNAPTGTARYNGRPVTLTVAAVGVPAPRYQWFKGDVAVTPVRATPAYTFTANAANAGAYRVVVRNDLGQVSTEPVTVDVQTKPVFTLAPVSQTVGVGGSVTFTANATGNPAPTLRWRKNGRDIPGATGPTYTIGSVTLADRAIYTAVASSTVNNTATATAVVTTTSTGARLTVTP
ncbi:MAG: immunoglobulin domain-containing protein [Opitutaceae bacterium]|jgi:hypothetical protein|nr:immunoglobulin domain-containing protein [Opitutaceae bacterium]